MADDINDLELYQGEDHINLSLDTKNNLIDISIWCYQDSRYLDPAYATLNINKNELMKIKEWIDLVLSANQDKQ